MGCNFEVFADARLFCLLLSQNQEWKSERTHWVPNSTRRVPSVVFLFVLQCSETVQCIRLERRLQSSFERRQRKTPPLQVTNRGFYGVY